MATAHLDAFVDAITSPFSQFGCYRSAKPSTEGDVDADSVRQAADAAAADLLSYAKEKSGWEACSDTRGVRIERCCRTSPHAWRAFGTIDASLPEVVASARLVEQRPDWDPMCVEAGLVQAVDASPSAFYCVAWWVFRDALGLVSARDMCVALTVRELEPGVWISACRSLPHPRCPEIESNVRGHAEVAGLLMEANASGGTDMTYVAVADPRGWLPPWLVNLGAGDGAYCIDNLRRHVLTGTRGDPVAKDSTPII